MTHRLNVLYKCMKFRRNISNGYQVIERTQFCDRQTDRQMDRRTQGENNMSPDPSMEDIINEEIVEFVDKYLQCCLGD